MQASVREWKAALPVYGVILLLYVLFVSIIPAAASSETSLRALKESMPEAEKIGNFFRWARESLSGVIEAIKELSLEKVLAALRDFPRTAFYTIRTIPAHIGNFLSNFAKQWRNLEGFLRQLWPPHHVWLRLSGYIASHRDILEKVGRAAAGCLVSMCALKLFALFVVPLLGLGTIIVLGLDVGILLVLLLNQLVSITGSWIGAHLSGRAGAWWERRRRQREEAVAKMEAWKEKGREQIMGGIGEMIRRVEEKRDESRERYGEAREAWQEGRETLRVPLDYTK